MPAPKPKKAPATIDEYLAPLPEWQRAALQRLRGIVHAAAPGSTEAISYQIPTIKVDGRSLVAFAAFKDHCSLFPMSLAVIDSYKKELEPFISGRGTVRFTEERPLPVTLVRKIVKARLKELAARKRR